MKATLFHNACICATNIHVHNIMYTSNYIYANEKHLKIFVSKIEGVRTLIQMSLLLNSDAQLLGTLSAKQNLLFIYKMFFIING